MTTSKVVLVVVALSSVVFAHQTANEDLSFAASKGKRRVSQLEPYSSLQFHRPPIPSIDYYGDNDKGHGGGAYGYDTWHSNGYAVGAGDPSESHRNGGGSFGGSYYVAKRKGKGGYPSKGKGASYGGKGKGGYGKGKGGSYGKGKGKGGPYGSKGKGGIPYGSAGYNPYRGEDGSLRNYGNGGYLYVSGAISNSYGSGGIGNYAHGSTGLGYNSFGSSQSGGSSSENIGPGFSAYGGGGSQANFYAGGGTQDSAYEGGGLADNYGVGGIDESYGIGGIKYSYGSGGVDDSHAIGVVDDSFRGGGVGDSYGIGGVEDSYGGGGVGVHSYKGSDATGGDGSIETSSTFTQGADFGRNTEGASGTEGSASSTGGGESLGGGGGLTESTGRKRSPSDTDENADKLPIRNATIRNIYGSKANTNSDFESNAKTIVNYNLSINEKGSASATNGNSNNSTVKVDIKTDSAGTAKNAFTVSIHVSSGSYGDSPSARTYVPSASPPIIIQSSSIDEEVEKESKGDENIKNFGGSSPGVKRGIAPVSRANQELLDSGEKSKNRSPGTTGITNEQVKDNKAIKNIAPVNNPIKLKVTEGDSGKPKLPKTIPSKASPPSTSSGKPGSSNRIPGRNFNVENLPQQVKGRNEARTNKTTTPSPFKKNTGSSTKPYSTEEQSSVGCTSGCFSIPPLGNPAIRGQVNKNSNSSINGAPRRIRKGSENVTTKGRQKNLSPASTGSTIRTEKSNAPKDAPKEKARLRSMGSTDFFINTPEVEVDGFEIAQYVKNGERRRNVGAANNTRTLKSTDTPIMDDIRFSFGFGGNRSKDSENLRPVHKDETKPTNNSPKITLRPAARHNQRPRPMTVTKNTNFSVGIKTESTKDFETGKSLPTDAGRRNAAFPINARLNTTRQWMTQRPKLAVEDTISLSAGPIVVVDSTPRIPLGVVGRGHRGLDTIDNGTRGSLKTKNRPIGSPVHFPRNSQTYNPILVTEDELPFFENAATNVASDHREQVSGGAASVRDERSGAKRNNSPSVKTPMIVPYLPIDTYYIPLRQFIRQKQTQRP